MRYSVALLGILMLLSLSATQAGEVTTVKPDEHKYLLLDRRLVETTTNAKLVLGTPIKAAENPLFQADQPWENSLNNLYPNVLWDEQEQVFKLWYKCVLADKEVIAAMDGPRTVHDVGWYLLYATSRDAIHWDKPALGLFKHDGDSATNIVARDCPNVGVFKDTRDPDPARRYKMVLDVGLGKPQVRFSADGVHWGEVIEAEGFGQQNGDTHNNALWDSATQKYLWFTKLYLGERTMARFESDDFIHWKNNGMILRSAIDEGKNSQTYCMTPFRYGSIWLAYVMIYHLGSGRSVDCELAWSPDALHWHRVRPGHPLIPHGSSGTYDSECIYAMAGPPIAQDGSLLIFYGGDDYPHTGWKRDCLPCLARLPLDHFGGYSPIAPEQRATLVTAPLTLSRSPLRITASAKSGSVRVTAIDDHGVVLGGTEAVMGEVTDHELVWKDTDLKRLQGRPLRLRIELERSTLWSISGIDLVEKTYLPATPSRFTADKQPAPVTSRTLTFDASTEGWKGVDEITHHLSGGASGGYIRVSRVGRSLPIALSPSLPSESPLAGNWPLSFGGTAARITCRVRAEQEGGKVQLELFAGDIANWSIQCDTTFGPQWRAVTADLEYDWSDEEAAAAGWRRAANGFSWRDTIEHVGKVVVVPVAAGAQHQFDLDTVSVTGLP